MPVDQDLDPGLHRWKVHPTGEETILAASDSYTGEMLRRLAASGP